MIIWKFNFLFPFFIEVPPIGFTGDLGILWKLYMIFALKMQPTIIDTSIVLLKMKLESVNAWGPLFMDVFITIFKETYEIKLLVFQIQVQNLGCFRRFKWIIFSWKENIGQQR